MSKLTKSWTSKQQKIIDSSMLKIGEMMEVINPDIKYCILLRTYDNLIALDNPLATWPAEAKITGRKLQPGESITLTQE